MDDELQKKLLEAGIMPQNAVKQMEQWQRVPSGSAEHLGEFSPDKIEALREDLEARNLPTLRETILDVDKIMSRGRTVLVSRRGVYSLTCKAGIDILKHYIFEIPKHLETYRQLATVLRAGSSIVDQFVDPFPQTITDVSVLYATISPGVSEPTHWFCAVEPGKTVVMRRRDFF